MLTVEQLIESMAMREAVGLDPLDRRDDATRNKEKRPMSTPEDKPVLPKPESLEAWELRAERDNIKAKVAEAAENLSKLQRQLVEIEAAIPAEPMSLLNFTVQRTGPHDPHAHHQHSLILVRADGLVITIDYSLTNSDRCDQLGRVFAKYRMLGEDCIVNVQIDPRTKKSST